MFAKSISEISPDTLGEPPAATSDRTRRMATLATLIACLFALALLLHERFGTHWLSSAYAVVETEAKAVSDRVLAAQPAPAAQPDSARHVALAEFLAKRYKVSQDLTLEFVRIAHAEARKAGLDPLLIMAVIGIESSFNPIAESVAGAKGLMQIIPRFHGEKLAEFGGDRAVYDPEANIRVGTRIIREYLTRTGNLGIALQMYAGALNDDNDTYTNKVFGEKQRLQRVVASFAEPAAPATPRLRVATRRVDPLFGD